MTATTGLPACPKATTARVSSPPVVTSTPCRACGSPTPKGARPPGSWRDPYSARTGDMVRRRFAGDIELFGYEDRMTVVNPSLPFTAAGEAEGYTNSAFAPSSQNTGATGRRGYGLCGRPSSKFRAPTAGWHTGATSANHVT